MGIQGKTGTLLAAAQSEAWVLAVKRVADAKTAFEEFHAREVDPVSDAHTEGRVSIEQVLDAEDAFAIYVDRYRSALDDLLMTTAPTLEALAFKIGEAHADEVFSHGRTDDAIKAVLADLQHLSAIAGSAP